MDSNTNSLVEQRFVSGYYKYKVYKNGVVVREGALIPEPCLTMPGVWVETNIPYSFLTELPNDIFKTRSQIWSWAQRVKLLERSGSAKPFHSNKNKSVNRGD